ncbi:hypothetical protein D3C79_646500 [compost metagenome]
MQAESFLQSQVVLQLLFPMDQAIVLEHPFALTFEQEDAAGRFWRVQRGVLFGCFEEAPNCGGKFVLMVRIKMKGNALNALFVQRSGKAPEVTHVPLPDRKMRNPNGCNVTWLATMRCTLGYASRLYACVSIGSCWRQRCGR